MTKKKGRRSAQDRASKKTATRTGHGARRRARDARLPAVGTVLVREIDGKTVKATVEKDGFLHDGKTYRSLSAVAQAATGTVWNGFLFFRLTKPVAATASKKGPKS